MLRTVLKGIRVRKLHEVDLTRARAQKGPWERQVGSLVRVVGHPEHVNIEVFRSGDVFDEHACMLNPAEMDGGGIVFRGGHSERRERGPSTRSLTKGRRFRLHALVAFSRQRSPDESQHAHIGGVTVFAGFN